jgi:hypothetical protein
MSLRVMCQGWDVRMAGHLVVMVESKVNMDELKVQVLRLPCSMAGHLVDMAESKVDMAELKVHVFAARRIASDRGYCPSYAGGWCWFLRPFLLVLFLPLPLGGVS